MRTLQVSSLPHNSGSSHERHAGSSTLRSQRSRSHGPRSPLLTGTPISLPRQTLITPWGLSRRCVTCLLVSYTHGLITTFQLGMQSAPVVHIYLPTDGPRRPASGRNAPIVYDFSKYVSPSSHSPVRSNVPCTAASMLVRLPSSSHNTLPSASRTRPQSTGPSTAPRLASVSSSFLASASSSPSSAPAGRGLSAWCLPRSS